MIHWQTGTFLNIVLTDNTLTNRNISKYCSNRWYIDKQEHFKILFKQIIHWQTGTFLKIVQTDDTLTNKNISKYFQTDNNQANGKRYKKQRKKNKTKNKHTKLQK